MSAEDEEAYGGTTTEDAQMQEAEGLGQNEEEYNQNEDDENAEDNDDENGSDDEDIVVTIGDIKTNVPLPKRGFQGQKLDPNVTPSINGKSIFDVNPSEFDEKPWLRPGANIADYFNFGFTEETWNEYAEKQRLLRLEYPTQAEVNKAIMDELKEKHGNKEIHIPVVMPVYNSGGRNLVTVQNLDKPPVKVGFPTSTATTTNTQPAVVRTVLSQPNTGAPVNIPSVNLASGGGSTQNITPVQPASQPEKIVVDLTRPPPGMGAPGGLGQDGSEPPQLGAGPHFNVPPPMVRLPTTDLTNLSRPPPQMFNRPSMGYYNPMVPPPLIPQALNRLPMRTGSHDDAPPGVGSSRQSMDGPPGMETTSYGGYSLDRHDRDRDRRKESEDSDEERRRRRRDRDRDRDDRRDRDRDRERDRDRDRDRDRESRRRRESPDRHEQRSHRDREERKRRSRDRDSERDRDRKRHKEDKEDRDRDRERRHRRERSPRSSRSAGGGGGGDDDGPPGV